MSPDPKAAFEALVQILSVHEPLGLLTQLTMTYLFVPSGEFQGESSDAARWQKQTEFIAGFILAREYPKPPGATADGATLEQIDKYINAYYAALDQWNIFGKLQASEAGEDERLLSTLRAYATHVRGQVYPHQLYEYARALYAPHNDWFRGNLGFTIEEAIKITEAIFQEYARRKFDSKQFARQEAKVIAEEMIGSGRAIQSDRRRIETAFGVHLHFGDAVNVLGFTADQLSVFAGVPASVANSFLHRMSLPFGYRNSNFPHTFTDAISAATDYNTLSERPLLRHEGRYWLLVPPVLKSALMMTFFFDLIGDKTYKPIFDQKRGAFLESQTATYLRRLFPVGAVVLNPHYQNKEEFCDVLVLHDRKILIFECKSKMLTHVANIGGSIESVKSDLEKGVTEAFGHGLKARSYLLASDEPELLNNGEPFSIDMQQVNAVHVISITLAPFQNLATRFANYPRLRVAPSGEPLWSLSLGSLDVLTQVLFSPARLLHYIGRRMQLERTPFAVFGDEMDLLGHYLLGGLYFSDQALQGFNALACSGLSEDIDRYVHERFEAGLSPPVPKSQMPPAFERFVDALESLGDDYATDCAIALLDLSYLARKEFIDDVERAKATARVNGGRPIVSMVLEGGRTGLSFLVLPRGTSQAQLARDTTAQAVLKKHSQRCNAWFSFGWVLESTREVDCARSVSYMWRPDQELDLILATAKK